MSAVLALRGVTKKYQWRGPWVLSGADLSLEPGSLDSSDNLYVTDPSIIIQVNRTLESWLKRPRAELLGSRFQDLLSAGGRIYYETHYAPLLQLQGYANEVALELLRRGSDPLPVLVNSKLHPASEGRTAHVRGIFFDATERRRYERQLLDARRGLEETVKARTAELSARLSKNKPPKKA